MVTAAPNNGSAQVILIASCDCSGQKKTKWGGVGWDVIALRLETIATEKRLRSERSGKRA